MRKYLVTLFPILLILFAAISIRVLFFTTTQSPYITPDGYGYLELGKEMILRPSIKSIITPYRTPLYPIIMASYIPGPQEITKDTFTPAFFAGLRRILELQTTLGVISVICIYLILMSLGAGVVLSTIGSLYIALNPQIFLWERTTETEGLSISIFIMMLYTTVMLMKKVRWIPLVVFCLLSIVGFLLRPANILIPLIILPFIMWNERKNTQTLVALIICLVVYISVPGGYVFFNILNHHYRGIQQVSDLDIFGRILEFNMPIDATNTDPYFYRITQIAKKKHMTQPFKLLDTIDPSIYMDRSRMAQLGIFNRKVISDHPLLYVQHALSYVPNIIHDYTRIPEFARTDPSDRATFLARINAVFGATKYLTWLVFFLLPFAGFLWIKKRTIQSEFIIILSLYVLSQIAMSVCIVYYEEYGRLSSIFIPATVISIILGIRSVWKHWPTKKPVSLP
jgi:hypothetical protein